MTYYCFDWIRLVAQFRFWAQALRVQQFAYVGETAHRKCLTLRLYSLVDYRLLMKHNSQYRDHRSIRLPEYDYSQSGIYFVTICTYHKQCLFGDIENGKMYLNQIGNIVREEWLKSAQIRREIELDE
ncbi:MAG: hypothetical protein ACRC1Z_26815 [Waterburya sp.]